MDTREHRRVRIRLPARMRWNTPFGQKIELCETCDVSRGGLLVSARESHAAGASLWVTFPYDVSLRDGQPEILARVVRCGGSARDTRTANPPEKVPSQAASPQERSAKSENFTRGVNVSDALGTFAVGIRFEGHGRAESNGNRAHHDPERRSSWRCTLGVPVRVRPEHVPWFEEAMTLDFSARGMRFRSHREYAMGEQLKIAIENRAYTPWPGAGEFRARVVRVCPAPDGVALDVSVCRAP
jgi:PilZ domain-containing protein